MSLLLYNPDKKDKAAFLDEFVIRTRIFDHMFGEIRTDKMIVPEQHYMIVGPRGAGKTSMLLRLKYAVEDDPVLSKRVIPVMFGEEQYNIGELGNLWERIAEYLEDYHGFDGITGEIEQYIYRDDYEEAAFKILIKYLDQRKQNRIMLLIDNIGQLFDKFEMNEIRRLREVLQTWPHIRLVAGSPTILHYIVDYDQPLHEFFKIIRLNSLTDEEAVALLRKLAIVHLEEDKIERILVETPERVATLNALSGGIPRTIVLLFNVFVDNEHGNALSDLEKILDAVTPLYKHRMDDLPPQQQKIIDAVALHWEPIEVKDLTKVVRLESKVISAQLRQLEKNQVVEKYRTKTKNHQYQLKERFFNIWYLMRYGRKMDRNKVIWLVKFLEAWCEKEEIERRIRDYAKKARKGLLDRYTWEIYGLVYSFFENVSTKTKLLLKKNVPLHLSENISIKRDELLVVFETEVKKRNFDKAIDALVSVRKLEWENKDKIFALLSQNDFELFTPFYSRWFSKFSNADFLHAGVEIRFAIGFILMAENAIFFADKEEGQNVAFVLERFSPVFGFNLDYNKATLLEGILIFLIQYLLAKNYFTIVLDFFDKNTVLKEQTGPLYELIQYFVAIKTGDEKQAFVISSQLQQQIGQERIDKFVKEVEDSKHNLEK